MILGSINSKDKRRDEMADWVLSRAAEAFGLSDPLLLNGWMEDAVSYLLTFSSCSRSLWVLINTKADPRRPLLKLPHPSNLVIWISNIDAEPGFLKNVFERLKDLPDESKDCSLVIDGMAIRKQILPVKDGKLKRLESTVKKLKRDQNYADYKRVLDTWEIDKIIERVPQEELDNPSYYIPLHLSAQFLMRQPKIMV
ncbi:hypothetical protein M8J77_013527 [Diaphorina citri]|nr:hypothetical protein M8J77_013527 [Diaphorina citri]